MTTLKNAFHAGVLFLKAVFSGKGMYRYSLRDLWHGAWIFRCGYTREVVVEKCLDHPGPFMDVDVNGKRVTVLKGAFRPGELAWLYQETFGRDSSNPHSYLKGQVTIESGDVVIDAGASEGFFVRLALEARCGHVYAFEPFGALFQGLSRTFHGDGRVSVVPCGLSDVEGRGRISSCAGSAGEARIETDEEGETVLTTLDAFVRERGLSRVDFIKMDIEGSEIKAIEGSRTVLRQFAPKLAIAVYHEYETAERLRELIRRINPDYHVKYGGCYMFAAPFRPFILYACRG